jgi:hypothetical protein
MTARHGRLGRVFMSCVFFIGLTACASVPDIKVLYQLPPKSDRFKGQKVLFTFEDARGDQPFLGEGARLEVGNFSGNFSFSVARYNEAGFKIGMFDLPAMVKEGFVRRLKNLGMDVISKSEKDVPELYVALKTFHVDYGDRKWTAKMNYVASIRKEGKTLLSQTISGETERYKVVGTSAADKALGELFTDMVNKVDLVRLFQEAGTRAPASSG